MRPCCCFCWRSFHNFDTYRPHRIIVTLCSKNFSAFPARYRKAKSYILAALAVTTGVTGSAILISSLSASSTITDLIDNHEDDEAFSQRFEGPGRYYAGIDDDWIIYSSVLWSNVLKAWFKVYLYEVINFNVKRIWDWLFPWEQSKSEDPWVLLELTKSSNFWIRQMGVASLANKTEWESYKYRVVAQACSHRTTVALARYPQANDLYFRPAPKVSPSQNSILEDLQHQVSRLPLPSSLNSKIYYYRHAALDSTVKYQKDPLAMDTLTQFYSIPGEDEKQKSKALQLCLQALLCYTEVKSYARMFVANHGLAVLLRLLEENSEESVVMYIASILCNLSQDSALLEDIVGTGWVSILRQWSLSSRAALSILALTILANLDHDWLSNDIYQDILLLHPTQRNSQPVHVDVVFVHGLRGGAVKTWRQRDVQDRPNSSTCWPRDWLAKDCPNTRILSIGYHSALFRWGEQCPYEQEKRTLESRGRDLLDKLLKAGVGSRPVIWIGHSMGGLLIKQILDLGEKESKYSSLTSQTKGVMFFSVPHKGSSLVDVMLYAKYLLFPSVEVQEMRTSSEKLYTLHNRFIDSMRDRNIPCLSFGENMKTSVGHHLPDVWMVPPESSNPGIGQFVCLPVNHINTCKPCDEEDIIYQRSREFLRDIIRRLKR
ncbi:serine active site containing 1 [Plakobranchus ocellatus]|uniref:Protein SERAC1 n=1 Tax=Plakobranchus ocellatus TaxID=259542 RepID=A0AAV4AEE1_9GAST|nr:serine active site containing 1 [Plakobranchus ocellatus]